MRNDPVAIARPLLGVRFRLQGRAPEYGLDCVGLIAIAFGLSDGVPTGYPLRGGDIRQFEHLLRRSGFVRRKAGWRRGDVLVLRPGPAQVHLGLWTGESLIHADAGLGRIVETPGIPTWPVLSVWLRRKGSG